MNLDNAAIYAGAKPEKARPVRKMVIIHRATGATAIATDNPKPTTAKPTTVKPARKLSGPRYRVESIQDTK